MKQVCSYGIIPLRHEHRQWKVLLIQHHSGHWSFPKGHPEQDELPLESAQRELQEETGLTVKQLLSEEPIVEKYFFMQKGERIEKTVYYYLALVEGTLMLQACEIKSCQWILLSDAPSQITFKEAKKVCKAAIDFVRQLEKK